MANSLPKRVSKVLHKAARGVVGLIAAAGVCSASAQTTVAGELTGQFAVSENGAATYQIPIQVPPGVAGVEPKLALFYNSQGGSGPLGMGWSLSGLSAITRCPKTKAQDGALGAVNFDLNDRYCLDGDRLVLVSGTEGASGAEYRTERDNFSRITAIGQAGNGPASFIVKTKTGQTMEYGNTADSRIEAQGKTSAHVWALNKVTDAAGNAMTVTYDEDSANGSFYPLRIDYAGGALVFDYEARTDFIPKYQAGSVSKTTKRLIAIRTLMPDASLLRKLTLSYAYKGIAPVSVITKIEVCDSGNKCLSPTTMAYGSSQMSWAVDNWATNLAPIGSNAGAIYFADWNGDGNTDFLWHEKKSGTNLWYISSGNGSFIKTTNPIPVSEMKESDSMAWNFNLGDWNGDGLPDFVWSSSGGVARFFINNGNLGFSETTHTSFIWGGFNSQLVGDWNGDGLADVASNYVLANTVANGGTNTWGIGNGSASFSFTQNAINTSTFTTNCVLRAGDWNGDGLTDVMCLNFSTGESKWFLNNGGLQFTEYKNPIPVSDLKSNGPWYSHFVDLNGDGLTDFVAWNTETGANKWFLNYGKLGFLAPAISKIDPNQIDDVSDDPGRMTFGDWNGDGIADALWYEPKSGYNRWYIGKGDLSFVPYVDPIDPLFIKGSSTAMYTGGWRDKGIDDVMVYNAATGNTKWFYQGYQKPESVAPPRRTAHPAGELRRS